MRQLCFILASLLFSVGLVAQPYQIPASLQPADYMPNTLIIKVKDSYRHLCTEQGVNIPALQSKLNKLGLASISKKFPHQQPPREKYNPQGYLYADLSLIYECKFSGNAPMQKLITSAFSSGVLVYAEPHFIPTISYSPNDPQATPTLQYHLQTINAFNAWNVNKGDTNVVIAITDTGTEPTHPDLGPNIKRNVADPIDMIDNDGDGYVDNYMGWDLGSNDNDPTWPPAGTGIHGVHTSGIASAATDNSIGVAGVGFKCKFLPVKIADQTSALVAAYEGIKYAADHGCKVINCSWGGTGGGQYGQDICTYAVINKDALVVAAAGNNGADQDFYPAAYQYVLSVANTQSSDVLNPGSNYGYFIDVCAPGTNINSTWGGGTYNNAQSGTSMSSPCVAGAAGIVRSYYPSYTALQTGERLRQTCDDIYVWPGNSAYANKLGKGRINLFKALTDPAAPAVVWYNVKVFDHNDSLFISGDTLYISGLFTNYLAPTTALSCTLVPLSAQAQPIVNTYNIGALGTLATVSNSLAPFKFKLTGSFATNTNIEFRLDMQDGSYTNSQYIVVNVNPDYVNITVNDIATTATGKGKIGYNQDNQVQGLGFVYGGAEEVYDAGLMIGVSPSKVSDCVRGSGSGNDADFNNLVKIARVTSGALSDFDAYTKFSDAVSSTTIGVEVEQRNYAWSTAPDKKYVIWEYAIKNISGAQLDSMYVGICADWDVDNYADNKSAYDAVNKMGYSWCTDPGGKYVGIKLLSLTAPPVFNAIDNVAGGNGGLDIVSGSFNTALKYKALSTNRTSAGTSSVTGNDVLNVMSSGPYSLAPNKYAVVAFALIAGNNLADIQASAVAAQAKYNTVASTIGIQEIATNDNSVRVYPNPATDKLFVSGSAGKDWEISIYDVNGKLVATADSKKQNTAVITTEKWARGMYLARTVIEGQASTFKIVLE